MESERRSISQPPDAWEAWWKEAMKRDQNLSEWIWHCCKAKLPREERLKLKPRRGAGRPPNK